MEHFHENRKFYWTGHFLSYKDVLDQSDQICGPPKTLQLFYTYRITGYIMVNTITEYQSCWVDTYCSSHYVKQSSKQLWKQMKLSLLGKLQEGNVIIIISFSLFMHMPFSWATQKNTLMMVLCKKHLFEFCIDILKALPSFCSIWAWNTGWELWQLQNWPDIIHKEGN